VVRAWLGWMENEEVEEIDKWWRYGKKHPAIKPTGCDAGKTHLCMERF